MPSNSLYSIYYRNFTCARILNQNITNDVKIFVPLARNCMGSACTTYALLSVLTVYVKTFEGENFRGFRGF